MLEIKFAIGRQWLYFNEYKLAVGVRVFLGCFSCYSALCSIIIWISWEIGVELFDGQPKRKFVCICLHLKFEWLV